MIRGRTAKHNKQDTFTSGLRPDWNSGDNKIKERSKKQTYVQISAGGLADSDAEDVNPYPVSKSRTVTEEELSEGAQKAKHDLSRKNKVNS